MSPVSLPHARRLVAPLLVVAGIAGAWAWMRWPDVHVIAEANPASVAEIDRAERATGIHIPLAWTGLHDISPQLLLAVLVAQDLEFFGPREPSSAGSAPGDAEPALELPPRVSVVTRSLASDLWLAPAGVMRRLREYALSFDLERFVGKRRILELYLNVAEFGPGVYGAPAAARRYFHKAPLFLTEEESAMLAAGLARPSVWNPTVTTPEYRARVAVIRNRMASAEFLWRRMLEL